MDPKSGNIYRNARITAGLTQERWAEYLGISADSVRKYENGEMMPAEDVLLMMADVSGLKILPYWHLSQKSRIAGEILPKLEEPPTLPQAVLALLIGIENFQERGLRDLIRIASDGKISQDEIIPYGQALKELTDLVRSAYAVGYSKE